MEIDNHIVHIVENTLKQGKILIFFKTKKQFSFFSNSRHNHLQVTAPRSRNNQRPYFIGEEMAEFGHGRPSAASSTISSSTNKDSIDTFSGKLRGGPRRVQSEELGELIGNGQLRHDIDSLADEEDESMGTTSSAKSQQLNPTQPKISEIVRSGSHRGSRSKFVTSESAEL